MYPPSWWVIIHKKNNHSVFFFHKTLSCFYDFIQIHPWSTTSSPHLPPNISCFPANQTHKQIIRYSIFKYKNTTKNKINPTINNNNNVYKNNFSIIKKTNYYGKNGIHSVPKQLLKKTYERHDTSTRTQRTGLNGKVYEKRNGKV
jgi:hypothetical protein